MAASAAAGGIRDEPVLVHTAPVVPAAGPGVPVARRVMTALTGWAAERGAHSGLPPGGAAGHTAARARYRRSGCIEHHLYTATAAGPGPDPRRATCPRTHEGPFRPRR